MAGSRSVNNSESSNSCSEDLLARFRRKIGENARAWRAYVLARSPGSPDLAAELANLEKATARALQEPMAWADGLALAGALWPVIEWRGRWLAWQELLTQALTVAQQLGDPARLAEILEQSGELARLRGDFRAGVAWQEQALAYYRSLGDRLGMGRTLSRLSQQHLGLSDYRRAEECGRESLELLTQVGNQAEWAAGLNNWGLVCSALERWDEALTAFAQAAAIGVALGDLQRQAKATNNRGYVYYWLQRWDEARASYEAAAAAYDAVDDVIHATAARVNLCGALHRQGQTEQALTLIRQLEPLARRLSDRVWLAHILNSQGVFLAALGREEEAITAYEQAAEIHLANGDRQAAAQTFINLATRWLDMGHHEASLACLRQVRDLLRSLDSPPGWLVRQYDDVLARCGLTARPEWQIRPTT